MRFLILSALLLSGCTVALRDERVDPEKLGQALNQTSIQVQAIINYIAALQEKGVLPKPEQEKPDASK